MHLQIVLNHVVIQNYLGTLIGTYLIFIILSGKEFRINLLFFL